MLVHPQETAKELIAWIRDFFAKQTGAPSAVIGISGGKDSSVVAALCVQALGAQKVYAVCLPDGKQPDISDSFALCEFLNLEPHVINIGSTMTALTQTLETTIELSQDALINIAPRLRMNVLYAIAQSLERGAMVANTSNASEAYVGYCTKWGDNVGDFAPLRNLLATEVVQLGRALNLPAHLVEKAPSDGLSGKTDEERLGFSYAQLDEHLLGHTIDVHTATIIERRHAANLHKLEPIPAFEVEKPTERCERKVWSM